jgi:hypothetical protein
MPEESKKERVDRELLELLNELRVALPGVQVLFAFLLIVPFSQTFAKLTSLQRGVYFASFALTSAATALLIAPSTYHRIRFRQEDKEQMLFTANRMTVAGSVLVALAISGVVFLVTDVLFQATWASVATALNAGWFGWFWYGLPLTRRDGSEEP